MEKPKTAKKERLSSSLSPALSTVSIAAESQESNNLQQTGMQKREQHLT